VSASASTSTSTSEYPEYDLAVPCPSDRSLIGYTSIVDLNTELRRHASAMAPPLNRKPFAEYRYHLCPQTALILNTNQSLVLPPSLLAHEPIFQCGHNGNALDSCLIQGGDTQVLLLDDFSDSTQRLSVVFQGLTFEGSKDISIAAFSTRTTARFVDCHWENAKGRAAIMIAKARALTWPQVPETTFAFDLHNIFTSRRQLEVEQAKLTMDFSCERCSFTVRMKRRMKCTHTH